MNLKQFINGVRLHNFRSVSDVDVELDNPTLLVGRNGAGKSNLVDAFALLSEIAAVPLQTVLDRRGGAQSIRFRGNDRGTRHHELSMQASFTRSDGPLTYSGQYGFTLAPARHHGFVVAYEQCSLDKWRGGRGISSHEFVRVGDDFKTNVEGLAPKPTAATLALPLIAGNEHFAPVVQALAGIRVYALQPSRIRDLQDPDDGRCLSSDGGNAASVLRAIEEKSPDDLKRIVELLASVSPGTTDVRSVELGPKLSIEFTQERGERKRARFYASSMSDGALRVLGILLAVYQRPVPSMLVFEEPEASIHPGAVGAVMDMLRHASRFTQVVATTHSPDLLDAKWIAGKHLRIVESKEGATCVSRVSEDTTEILTDHFQTAGELLRSNALRPMSDAAEGLHGRRRPGVSGT